MKTSADERMLHVGLDCEPIGPPYGFMINTDDLGTRIQHYRVMLQLSQEQLAERVGVKQPTVYAWETGKNFPKVNKLPAIVKALELGSIAEFWSPLPPICRYCHKPWAPVIAGRPAPEALDPK